MAVQEQELNLVKLKCEGYKRSLSTLQKQVPIMEIRMIHKLTHFFQFTDLKKAVSTITELNRTAAKFTRPKNIVRNVSVQVPVSFCYMLNWGKCLMPDFSIVQSYIVQRFAPAATTEGT